VGEKTHKFTACLIEKAVKEHSMEVMQLTENKEPGVFDEAYKETVADKSATDMTDMMYYTATLRSDYPLTDIDADEVVDEDEEPPEDHDDQYQAKLFKNMAKVPATTQKKMMEGEIAPLDALFPMMQVLSDHEKQKTHHKMSTMHALTYKEDVQTVTYQENGSRAENVTMMALHHPRDRQNQTASPALTMLQGASRQQGEGEDQDDPLRHRGGGGHN
jgi:hypothetical protein